MLAKRFSLSKVKKLKIKICFKPYLSLDRDVQDNSSDEIEYRLQTQNKGVEQQISKEKKRRARVQIK